MAILTLAPLPVQSAAQIVLKDDGRTAGYVTLGWEGMADGVTVLQVQKNGAWVTVYEGPDTATTLTGLADGRYVFRAGPGGAGFQDDVWSAPFEVTVAHHSLTKAFSYFAGGLVLFIALCVLLFVRPFSSGTREGEQI